MTYYVVQQYDVRQLAEQVTILLRQGWVLAGGIAVAYDPAGTPRTCFLQAMVKTA